MAKFNYKSPIDWANAVGRSMVLMNCLAVFYIFTVILFKGRWCISYCATEPMVGVLFAEVILALYTLFYSFWLFYDFIKRKRNKEVY